MASIDFSHLTLQERIELIGDLCESIEDSTPGLTPVQAAEIDRRVAALPDDVGRSRSATAVLADLRRRHHR